MQFNLADLVQFRRSPRAVAFVVARTFVRRRTISKPAGDAPHLVRRADSIELVRAADARRHRQTQTRKGRAH
jgi:hypothetical protein